MASEPQEVWSWEPRLRKQLDKFKASGLFLDPQFRMLEGCLTEQVQKLQADRDTLQTIVQKAVFRYADRKGCDPDNARQTIPRMAQRIRPKLEIFYKQHAADPGPVRVTIPEKLPGWFPEVVDSPSVAAVMPSTDGGRSRQRYKKTGATPSEAADNSQPGRQEQTADLDPFRREWHHYHLTLNKKREPVWIYKKIDFTASPSDQNRLATQSAILPERGADPKVNRYQFEASMQGPHLMMRIHRLIGKSGIDILTGKYGIGIELYPYVGEEQFSDAAGTLYSARINSTWHPRTVASSIAILSLAPRGTQEQEGPVSQALANDLLKEWNQHAETHPEIVRLPFVSAPLRSDHTLENQPEVIGSGKWDHRMLRELLATANPGDEIRIWATFFDDAQMWTTIKDLLERGVRLQILMMNPGNAKLVRSRFRNRSRFGGLSQNPPVNAIQEITTQIKDLRKLESAGVLTIQLCDTMPFGIFYQVADKVMLVGLLLSAETWRASPLIKVYPGSEDWKVLSKSWDESWRDPLDPKITIKKKARGQTD